MRACIASKVMRPVIEGDIDRAPDAGVESTPTFIIGGQMMVGCAADQDLPQGDRRRARRRGAGREEAVAAARVHPLVALLYEGTARAARLGARLRSRRATARRAAASPPGATSSRGGPRGGRTIAIRRAPLVWVHAPSVGEGLQARPVLDALRRLRPELQLAYTFFSPSAEPFARTLPVDGADYLPFDTAADARAMLDAIRPQALVFSQAGCVADAHARGRRARRAPRRSRARR